MSTAASHVVFVGLPGAGKSTVAQAVARNTGFALVDLDAEIERIAGRSIPEIFGSAGEAEFRHLEVEATRRLLSRTAPTLVDAGGGWIANAGARELVPGHWAILYLRVTPAEAADRLGGASAARPLLADAGSPDEVRQRLEELASVRDPLYERADQVVETGGRTLEEVVREVADLVGQLLANGPAAGSRS